MQDRAETPLSEEQLLAKALACENCLGWLEHCKAACCRSFSYGFDPSCIFFYEEDRFALLLPELSADFLHYLELHNVTFGPGFMLVPKSVCERKGDRLCIGLPCQALTDEGLCAIHDTTKPEMCHRSYTEEMADVKCNMPKRCLYAYKVKALEANS